jgi:ADP-ribosylglycohydrolase
MPFIIGGSSVPEAIRSTWDVVDTLYAAMWAVSQSNSFDDAVLTAVNL